MQEKNTKSIIICYVAISYPFISSFDSPIIYPLDYRVDVQFFNEFGNEVPTSSQEYQNIFHQLNDNKNIFSTTEATIQSLINFFTELYTKRGLKIHFAISPASYIHPIDGNQLKIMPHACFTNVITQKSINYQYYGEDLNRLCFRATIAIRQILFPSQK